MVAPPLLGRGVDTFLTSLFRASCGERFDLWTSKPRVVRLQNVFLGPYGDQYPAPQH